MTHTSHDRFAEGYLLTRPTMKWFYEHYLRGPGDVDDWRASPLRTANLSGVASALVLTAGNDVLCDEGQLMPDGCERPASRCSRGIFRTRSTAFCTMGKIVRSAGPALDDIAAFLQTAFANG